MSARVPSRSKSPADPLGRYAPAPFVAASAVLVLLIVFTPVLLSTGPSPLLTQGELTIDRVAGQNWTKFWVMPLDPHAVLYRSITLAVGTGFSWNGTCPTSPLSWSTTSDTQTHALSVNTTADPVVVNATAVYAMGAGRTVYAGEYAFDVVNPGGPSPTMLMVPCTSATPGATVPEPSVAVTNASITFGLVNYGSGGVP